MTRKEKLLLPKEIALCQQIVSKKDINMKLIH